jgi:predicted Zn finger-like uncharacterized protein
MKFVCERCHTRYSIADDKVRQKILKIRCKTCENVITVRDPGSSAIQPAVSAPHSQPPPAPAPSRAPAPPMATAREWFVAINGQQEGPVTRGEAAKRISEALSDDEVYIWKEGLDGWKPPHEVPPIQQELNALRARSVAPPPPRGAARVPAPARGPMGSHAAAARSAPAAQASAFGDEDHTQIQPFDAAMLAPDAMKPASAPGSVLPFRGRSTNGVPVSAPAAANLDGLFSDLPAAAPGAGGFAPGPAGLHAPVRSDSSLSQLTGFAGFMSRNPGLKFVAAGAVVVVLLALAVIVLARMPGDPKPPPPAVANAEKAEPPTTLDILPGRPLDEKPSTKSVLPAGASRGPSMGPAHGAKGKSVRGPQRLSVSPPPASGSLEPPPVADGTSPQPRTAAPGERVVPTYQPKNTPLPGASGTPKEGVINAVVNKHENKVAITACYERALKRDEKLRSGKMNVSLTVKPSGIPGTINITAPPEFASVEACIKQAVRRWMFPASSEEYQIEFPLIMAGNL